MAFRVLIVGATGQVGSAVVRALAAEPSCAEVGWSIAGRFPSPAIRVCGR
jgi:nucleoside-diphosphate-sugar epimerase